MIVSWQAACPECGRMAWWTQVPSGTGNAAPAIDCKCNERLVTPADLTVEAMP